MQTIYNNTTVITCKINEENSYVMHILILFFVFTLLFKDWDFEYPY